MKASFIHNRDPNSVELYKLLKSLPKVPGVCIFIDLVNSTEIKYNTGIEHWGRLLNNTFNMINVLNDFQEFVVKGIGDELMIYIPEKELNKRSEGIMDYFTLLAEVHSTLDTLENYPLDNVFMKCKACLHYCRDVYNITYFKNANDYYGKDIDLSARLMTKSKQNRIVISDTFYQKIAVDIEQHPEYAHHPFFNNISDKYIEEFKGVPRPTAYRFLDV